MKSLRLRLRPTAESIVRGGHPWVFAESIKEQNRPGTAADLAVIFDRNDKFLAIGLYDPDSPIRVRILHTGKPIQIDAAFWKSRFETALAKRAFDQNTNGYRVINGENDGFPGLVLDRYNDTFVMKLYTAVWFHHYGELIRCITTLPQCERLVLRLSRNIQTCAKEDILFGPPLNEPIQFLENGIRLEADVIRGQKTGFFLDQRENRAIVETLSRGRHVLNAFSFSGGFSLYAARGGAESVSDLDISAHALASAKRNFALNPFTSTRHESIQTNAFDYLAQKPSRKFGLIILDPPSLAKREQEKQGALNAYRQLAQNAIPWLDKNGILVAASCSAHVTPEDFFQTITALAGRHGLKEFRRTENPLDHPATFPEARYLKCIYLSAAPKPV